MPRWNPCRKLGRTSAKTIRTETRGGTTNRTDSPALNMRHHSVMAGASSDIDGTNGRHPMYLASAAWNSSQLATSRDLTGATAKEVLPSSRLTTISSSSPSERSAATAKQVTISAVAE